MRFYLLIISSLLVYNINFTHLQNSGIAVVKIGKPVCDHVPPLNQEIISFVKTKINKQVGRGECWDLAAEALNTTGATWDKNYIFGTEVDVKKDCVYPGDIMQFKDVVVEYSKDKLNFKEKMAQHTAIIYEVKGDGDFVLADQNTTTYGRKVGLNPLNIKNITKGKFMVYRPKKTIKQ